MKKTKVMHIINDTNIGGAGRLLYNLCKTINHDKYEMIIVVPKSSDLIKLFSTLDNVMIFVIDHGQDRSFDLLAIIEIRRIIKQVFPDIVHTHSSLSGRIGCKLASFDTFATLYTKHCVFDVPRIRKSSIIKKLYRIVDNLLSNKVIAVAESARCELIETGVDPQKISVIINGSLPLNKASSERISEIKRELGISERDIVVGISARLEEYKGHKTMIRAAEKIKKQGIDNVIFLVLGTGSIEKELKKYAADHNVENIVKFIGFKANVSDYVSVFDVNINCSTGTETSSLAISEGLSIGKPGIVSDYGGNPNMIINEKTGYIFRQNDEIDLSQRIIHLAKSPDLLKYMSKMAVQDYFDRFSAERMARQYEEIYNNMIMK